jgi:phosphoribosylaminoimidazole-succinocarboxamide synthase
MGCLLETHLEGLPRRQGKVRDVYDLGDRLLLIASDRISAFDWVLPTGIPDKGRILTGLSAFWFARLNQAHHLLSTDIDAAGLDLSPEDRESLRGRSMIARKTRVFPFECVVRGYLSGSGWKEYQASGSVCGERLPPGLVESDRLPEPIFTPATKAESGHDENVSFGRMADALGRDEAELLRAGSLTLYRAAAAYTESRGLILADTKFEWGRDSKTGEVLLIDEVLTPDSSRYWEARTYRPGGSQPSFDKQYVRDWLETTGWDKASTPPPLPSEVVTRTRTKYVECYERLTGESFPW